MNGLIFIEYNEHFCVSMMYEYVFGIFLPQLEMEREQEVEWVEAQKITVTPDLVDAAKKQLHFLSTIDQHRCLYDGPLLLRAIFRYI